METLPPPVTRAEQAKIQYVPIPRLKQCPASGAGVHRWVYYAAATLIPFFTSREQELASYIEGLMTRPPSPHCEIEDAICSAKQAGPKEKRRKVSFDHYTATAFAERFPVSDYSEFLRGRSPVDPLGVTLQSFLESLFHSGETVLLFNDERTQGWPYEIGKGRNLENFTSGESGAWFLSNPVSGVTTKSPRTGRSSRRSKEHVTAFRHLLIESDQMSESAWTSILAQLPLPIVCVTHSGGKSLHALVRVDAESEQEYEDIRQKLREILVPLGACEASLSSVRLTRLPGVRRGPREQSLLFCNPNADATPIKSLVERSQN